MSAWAHKHSMCRVTYTMATIKAQMSSRIVIATSYSSHLSLVLTNGTDDGRLSVVLGGNVVRVQGTEPLQVGGGGGIGGVDHGCFCARRSSTRRIVMLTEEEEEEGVWWCSGIFG